MKNSTIVIAGGAIILLVAVVFYVSAAPKGPALLDGFAQCLEEKGVKFYGAFWCSHCQAQKKLFGASASKLPYIECSTADGNAQTAVCIAQGIKNYPTWVFADGSTTTGELSLATLSERSSCALPGNDAAVTLPASNIEVEATPVTAQ